MSSRTPQPDDDGFTGYEPEPLPYPDIDTGGKDPWEERLRAIGKLPEKPTPKPVDIPDLDAPKEHLASRDSPSIDMRVPEVEGPPLERDEGAPGRARLQETYFPRYPKRRRGEGNRLPSTPNASGI